MSRDRDSSRRSASGAKADHILEQALKHELRAASAAPGGCLDAETLAAWTDDGLDAIAMSAAESHIATCARCQAMAAAFGRATPVVPAAPEARSFPLWKWWLAPIAAGVTAVTLWMVIPEQQRLAGDLPQAKDSREPSLMTTAPDQIAPAAPTAPPARVDDQFADRDRAAGRRENRAQPPIVAERKTEEAAALQERITVADAATGAALGAAARAEAVAPAAPPPPAAPRAAAAPAFETVPAPQLGALQKSVDAGIEVATLDRLRKWRIAGERIERTEDGGKTWIVVRQSPDDAITAGSAPNIQTAWFVGRAGRIITTSDGGRTFTDVSLAEPLDIASVSATDAATAQIFTVSGRRFRTQDAGRTWLPF